ncbi:MAG TPA: anthranilate synthase component I, partial [Verrucomicrobiae bacterium]|nr:anthranilate synthase component I [Verrucomicrobiae bacterium]
MHSPTLDEFLKLAEQSNLIPVTRRLLADIETPLSAYRKIRGVGESFLFESVEGGEHLGRYSFVGCNPRAVIKQTGNRVEVIENGKVIEDFLIAEKTLTRPADTLSHPMGEGRGEGAMVKDGLEVVERVMKKYRAVSLPGLPRFTGGAIGFVGYEFIHDIEPVVPRPPHDELQMSTMVFLIADQLLIFDRVAQTITVLVNAVVESGISPVEAYEDATSEIDRLVALLAQPSEHNPVTLLADVPSIPFESNVPKEKFSSNVLKAKE